MVVEIKVLNCTCVVVCSDAATVLVVVNIAVPEMALLMWIKTVISSGMY